MDDQELTRLLLGTEQAMPTSRLGRLARTGRGAIGLASSILRRRPEDDLDVKAIVKVISQLGELKGMAMKAGQMLSYLDASVPEEVRLLLSTLQRAAVASEFAAIASTIRQALGSKAEDLLATMERTPIAVASIGQVHRAWLPDGRPVAVKVRHPGIEVAMSQDFEMAMLGTGLARVLLPGAGAQARDMVTEARSAFLAECNFTQEAAHQQQFGAWFEGHPTLRIPAVHAEWSSPTVLTTDWAPGLTLDAFLAMLPTQTARDRAGEALFRFYLETLARHGVFHADPHPGNYAFTPDGEVTVYDFGCVRTFDSATVTALADLVIALRESDIAAQTRAGYALGFTGTLAGAELSSFQRFARGFFAPILCRGPSVIQTDAAFEAQTLLRDKRALLRLGVPGRLLFLFRIRFGLYAVLARLAARLDWGELETQWSPGSCVQDSPRLA